MHTFEAFKEEQPIAYKMLDNIITKQSYSHAYLFETNGYQNTDAFILGFVKQLMICDMTDETEKKLICTRIDTLSFPDIKIIIPDGQTIKKEQIDELQEEFNKTSVETSKKIYIIKDSEKLNQSSSNALLKFLEEPSGNIIAILLTSNIYQLLPTIQSRCQIIKLKKNVLNTQKENLAETLANILYQDQNLKNQFLEQEETNPKIPKVIEFIEHYENNKVSTLLSLKKIWFPYFKEKEDHTVAFQIMLFFYKDILNQQLQMPTLYDSYHDKVNKIARTNNTLQILKKINLILAYQKRIKSNMNLHLLMDKFILQLEETDGSK